MAGFFGLFGKKDNTPKDAYFLSADESKTYGDIDYMRTSKTVRRTFVKTVGNPDGGETISQVSSSKAVTNSGAQARRTPSSNDYGGYTSSYTPPATESQASTQPTVPSAPQPKSTPKGSNNMDMFRNMAKQIRK